MLSRYIDVYDRLYAKCASDGFAGYDPFDGLESSVFRAGPWKHFRAVRLLWQQAIKRSPIDLRRILHVKKGVNPKALSLFAMGELSRARAVGHTSESEHKRRAAEILSALGQLSIRSADSTLSYGYDFDWQSRYFFAPKGTPAIVPTAFASQAYFEAARVDLSADRVDIPAAVVQIGNFVASKLNRSFETDDEVCFSYTDGDRSMIFNASLLAAECLTRASAIEPNVGFDELAIKAVEFVVRRQRADGAWAYGIGDRSNWVDNFHTAYVLLSIRRIADSLAISLWDDAFYRGLDYWLDNFFLPDGTPGYLDTNTWPVDIHSAAVSIAAMAEIAALDRSLVVKASKVADWTLSNMLGPDGMFYYQLRQKSVVKTPFMRWGQAWMTFALARLIEALDSSASTRNEV